MVLTIVLVDVSSTFDAAKQVDDGKQAGHKRRDRDRDPDQHGEAS